MCDQPQTPKCQVCDAVTGLLRCAKCKSSYYCSTSHQHIDWPRHKRECRWLSKQKKENQNRIQNSIWADNSINLPTVGTSESEILATQAESVGHSQRVTGYSHNNQTTDTSRFNGNKLKTESMHHIRDELISSDPSSQSERRYEELCRIIIRDMNTYGLSVVDDFLGRDRGLQIFNEVHKMYAAGVFRDGQLVKNSLNDKDLRTIRGDKITWVKGTENGCTNIGYLINQIDAVVSLANTMRDNGQLGNYKIRERTKAMVACYPGSGAHYVMHVDNPNRDGRVITAIYYLNLDWDTQRSGGILRIFPENGGSVADIEPKFDRIIFFWSDRRNPHEVQPSNRTRYAITVWYFDANEREAALNRCRQYNNQTANCT